MNSILFTGDNSHLSKEDEKTLNDAQQIIIANCPSVKHEKARKKHTGFIVFFSVFLALLFLIALFSTIFALVNTTNNKIIKGISVLGIDISELTKEDAKVKLYSTLGERLSTDLIFKHNNQTYTLLPTEVQFSFDIEGIVEDAYSIGRNGNILQNNYSILNCLLKNTELTPELTYNDNLLQELIPQMNSNFDDGIQSPSYVIDGVDLIISSGKDGYKVKYHDLKSTMLSRLMSINYSTDSIEIPVEFQKCDEIDIDKIHSEIYKEAIDASYTQNPFTIIASSNGLDFNITVDEAKSLITGDKDSYTIPLKILYPKVTTNDIGTEAFPNLLASFSTNYSSSNYNRSTNIALATSKINGIVLMPGDTFSYNNVVGRRTVSAGFKEAGAYSNGQVVSAVGGGICQVSSTLYNAVLRANLDIVDRTNHQFQVGYVPIGTDATVSWGSPDFKFKNSRSYPIKIVATTANKNVYIKIFGIKEETEYEVEIQSYRTSTIAYKTTYTVDSNLGSGKTKVIQSGSNGAKSETYKILKLNGTVVSKTLISKDTYQPHNQIIAKGE